MKHVSVRLSNSKTVSLSSPMKKNHFAIFGTPDWPRGPEFWEIIPKPTGNLGPQASKVLTCDPGFAVDGKAMVWRRSVVCLFLIQIEKAKHASETR